MPYVFNNITLEHIDSTGGTIDTFATFTAGTIPALTKAFAIGNKIRLTLTIDATGFDTFTGKYLRFNPALFTINNNLNAFQYGYESPNPLSTTIEQANLNFASPFLDNCECEMTCNLAATEATIYFDFYVTQDVLDYLSPTLSAQNTKRFVSTRGQGSDFVSLYQSVYNTLTRNIGIVAQVFDYTPTTAAVTTPTGGRFMRIPVAVRWYNADIDDDTTGMRFIKELEITSASQVALSLSPLTDVTATGPQATAQNVQSIYTINSQQLAVNEANSVRVLLSGDAFVGSGGANPAITDVRALLFRIDNATNTADFITDLSLSDALIPQGAVGSAQIDGAIWTPSDWFENVPNPDDIEVQFTIDGNAITYGGQYYIVINIHDSANPDYVTSHISPPLNATYVAPVLPTITGYLSTYNQQYSGNELTVAPHQRVKARLHIDKTSYTGFDTAIAGIICKLTNITGVVNQVQGWLPNGIVTPDLTVVTDDANDLILNCIFRIAEEYAGTSTTIVWTISLNQATGVTGQTQFTQITYEQKLDVSDFENDAIAPNLLAVRFYDFDDYQRGVKTEIVDICDADQIIAEVEKDPAFTGSINLVATIYPASETGDTNVVSIEEEEDWTPVTIQMQQLVSGKLDNVDISFGGDDFAVFRINCQQLTQGQRYWVTAIAFEQFPDYCPFGLVQNIEISTFRPAAFPFWAVSTSVVNFVNEITAHPDYIGNVTVVYQRVVDVFGNPAGLQNYNTSVIPNDLFAATIIPPALGTVYYEMQVNAEFDSGSGTHLIAHNLRVPITLPVVNTPPVVYDTNTYTCTDLG